MAYHSGMKNLVPLLLTCVALAAAQATKLPPVATVLPGTVVTDGATNPAAIPDHVALRMFFLAAPKINTSAAVVPKSSIRYFMQQLKPADNIVLLNHIGRWKTENAAAVPMDVPHVNAAAIAELALLHAELSADGWQSFAAELSRRKAHIKIYDVPASAMPMPKGK